MDKVGVVGFSWGGMADLIAAATDSRIRAVVSLDGPFRYVNAFVDGGPKAARDVSAARITTPLLFVGSRDKSIEALQQEKMDVSRSFLNEMTHADVYLATMRPLRHVDLASQLLRFTPADPKEEYDRQEVLAAYGWTARYVQAFLDTYLKDSAAGRSFLQRSPAENGVPRHMMSLDRRMATAELDVRTTSEANSTYLSGLIRQFIAKQGYQLLDHEPTDEERARFPLIARLQEGLPAEAARQPMDAPVRRWVEQALTTAHQDGAAGKAMRPVLLRASGGTVPTHEIVSPLNIPFALVTVVNADNNQHTYDENLRMGNYLSGMRSMLGLLTTPFPGK